MIKLNWFIPIILLAMLFSGGIKAEGLKELANGTTNYPVTSFGSNGWADPGASAERRLHIYIEDPTSESVYFGFSRNNETYNVFDPNGNLVFTGTSNANCPNAGVAITGPSQVVGAGGYDATNQVYTPAAGSPAGNYYIEFDGNASMDYWDISVAKSGNTTTELGRLWSMIWWFNMGSWNASASFEGTMYAYSTEGFVSKVDYKDSNFRPYVFSIYYNATGPGNTGDLVEDRKSVNGSNAGTPSFPVFLNPPPEAIMPSATFGDIVATPSITRTAATGTNKYSFNLSSTQPGTFTILLNVYNESVPDVYDAVANTTDRMIVFNVEAEPGETPPYVRAIPWDGVDGDGNTLPDGYLLHYTVFYGDGRSHFPTYDAEFLADGLTVTQVRPSSTYDIELYWDDSNIPDDPTNSTHGDFSDLAVADKVELNGAATPNHKWVNEMYGDANTINTWWYCNVKQEVEQVEPLPPLATAEPDTQAYDIVFSEIGNTAMKVNWTNGNGTRRAVFMAQTTTGQAFPVDGTTYAASTTFGSGDQIGTSGWYCIYNGADSPELFVEGLAENTDYRVMVCEYNTTAGGEDYNTNTAVDNPLNQATITLSQATNVTFTNVLANSMTVDWTNGTGTRRVAFIKLTATAGDALPVNNITYAASSVYGVGDQIGATGWYCIYNGTGSSVDLTNLAANTDYTVMVCEYLGSDGNQNYLTVTNATDPNNQVTAAENPAHHIVFSNVTTNSMQIDWTDGTGDARYVFVKETTSTTEDALPVDGTVYAANTVWSTGDQIGTSGWYCVYSGTGSSVTITGLSQSTTYRVKVSDYDGAQLFIPGAVPTNPLSQSTLGTTPSTQAHNITFANTGATSMDVSWTNGSGTRRVVFAMQGNTGSPTAVDATVYAANSGFGLGDQIGTSGWYCIYNGTGSSVTMNNILQATEYRFKVCEYNLDASGPLYNNVDTILNPNNNTSLTAGVTVSNISQNTTELGGTATFDIVLNTQPTHDVVIGLSSDDTGEGTVQASVSFSSADWDIAKTITVTGQDDIVYDGNINYNIITAAVTSTDANYDGIDPDDVAVINEDNEAAPTVDLSVSPASIAEDGSSSTITATLSVATYEDVTVTIAASNGTAESGDYTLNGTTITILAGATTGTETLSSTVDAIYEGDETVLVDITAVSGGAATENGTQQETITILDNEPAPTVDLSVSPASIAEDGSSSTITATLSVATYEDVTVTIAASNGTAESGDYTLNGTSITILAGATTGTETLSSTVDAIYEGDETVLVDITAVSGGAATENGTQQETITILDDEAAPTVDLSVSPASIAEDGSSSTITATLSVATYEDVTVTIAASNGTAESGDYTLNGTSITILAGATTGTETLSSTVDAIYEGDETVLVDITAVSGGGATENGTQQETITILDDEAAPTVDLSVSPASIAEDGSSSTITATLSGVTYEDVTVTIAASNGTAESGDYTLNGTTITILAGATTGTETLSSTVDAIYEGDETVLVDITAVSGGGATENGTQQETITILDDEAAPTVDLSVSPASIAEDGSSSTITATLSGVTYEDVTVTIAASNGTAESGDYTLNGTTITILAGATTGTETLSSTVDAIYEGDETVLVDITAVSGGGATENGTQQETITILDDEAAPTVDLSVSPASIAEDGSSSTITATLSVATFEDVTVTIAASNGTAESGDYTLNGTSITILAGATTGTETLSSTVDAIYEGDETVLVDITAVSGGAATENGTQQETITILDDEAAPTVDLSVSPASIAEDGSSSTITATLSVATFEDVTVTIAATNGTAESGDYTLNGTTITILAGATTGTETLSSTVDAIYEGDETVLVDITAVSGGAATENGTQQETITILDDEAAPTVDLSVSPASIAEDGSSSTITATLSVATYEDVTVTIAASNGTAESGDYTLNGTSITILAGATTGTETLSSTVDAIYEGDETVLVDITAVSGGAATENGTQQETITILDDEAAPTVDLSVSPASIAEDGSSSTITATLSVATYEDVTVTIAASNGTAESGDYTLNGTSITILAGATTGTETLSSTVDAIYEGDETVLVDITAVSGGGATENGTQQETITILDDEAAPTVDLSVSPASIAEDGSSSTITATLSVATFEDVTVTIAASNGTAESGDYILNGTSITILAGATTGTETLSSTVDAIYEGDETVLVDITAVSGGGATENGTQQETITILDDELAPTVSLSALPLSIVENAGVSTLTATLNNATTTDVTVTLAYTGSATGLGTDYTAASTTITILAGATTGTTTITSVDDILIEGDEDVIATITNITNASAGGAQSVTVTIIEDDFGPTAQDDIVTLSEDNGPTNLMVLNDNGNGLDDFGADGPSTGTITITSMPTNGSAVVNDNGTANDPSDDYIVYTPNLDYNGADAITYEICDATGDCDQATVTITVDAVNDAPVVDNENVGTLQDTPFTGDLIDLGDTDVDGNLTANTTPLYGPFNGGIVINTDGTYTYTPNAGYFGNDTIVVEICDDGTPLPAICVNDTIFMIVTANATPVDVAGNGNESMSTTEDASASNSPNVLDNNTDPEGDPMNVVIVNPGNGTVVFNPADSTLAYTPNPDFCGQDTVLYDVCDAYTCNHDTLFVDVACVNDSPTAGNEQITIDEDNPIAGIDLDDNNTDVDGDPLTVNFPNGLVGTGGGTFIDNGDGTVDYTPAQDFYGNDTLIYTVCDPTPLCVTDTIIVTVNPINDAPVVDNEDVFVDEDDVATGDLTDAGDEDVDGTLTATTLPVYGPFNGAIVIDPDGSFTYTPDPDFNGADTVVVEICDDGYPTPIACVYDTIFITVNPVNDVPLGGNELVTIDEDNPITGIDLDDNNSDTDGDPLTVTFPNGLVGTGGGTFIDNGDGTVDYTPAQDFYGNDTLIYAVCDPTPACVNDTLIVTVNPINDVPVIDNENIGTTMNEPFTGDLTDIGDTDVDGNLTANTTPLYGPFNGGIVIDPDGTYTYTPNNGYLGNDTIVVEICDDGFPLPAECVNDTIFVVVTDNNTPVDTGADGNENMTTTEDSGASSSPNVLDNNEDPEGDPMNVVIVNPGNGTAVYNPADSTITYTPNPDFCGQDTVLYDVCDAYTCNNDTLFVEVICVNDAPDLTDGSITTEEDVTETVCLTFTDIDGVAPFTATTEGCAENGTASVEIIADEVCITYVPNENFNGLDSVCVTLCDADGACVTDTIPVVVTPVNDDPVVTEDTLTTSTPVNIPVEICITATDADLADETPSDTLGVCGFILDPANGAAADVSDTSLCFTYVPNTDYVGYDTLTVVVCDGNGGSDTVSVVINVTPDNDPAELTDTVITTVEDSTVTVCIPFTDPDGVAPYTATIGDCSENGTASAEVIGDEVCITYIPDANFNGLDSVCVTLCDAENVCVTDTIPVVVDPVNDIPQLPDTVITTVEDSTITVCLEITDEDGVAPYTATIGDCAENGTASVEVVGDEVCITYIPDANFNGLDSVCVTICDAENVCLTDTIPVVVDPVNDIPEITDTTITTQQDSTITVCVPFTDEDGVAPYTATIGDCTENGTATVEVQGDEICITYIPNPSYSGLDTVCVTLCDAENVCVTDTIPVDVIPFDPTPDAVDDADTSRIGEIVIDILDNDNNVNDTTSVSILDEPNNGTAELDGNNNIVYTPDLDFCGTDTISYEICNEGICDQAMVYINVIPMDSDEDGIADYIETLTADTDNDGTPNYLDLDSDGDGIPDAIEALGDLSDPCDPVLADTDNDGIDDYVDLDSDNDGVSDKDENDPNGDGEGPDDTDGDGTDDYRDTDDDDDGVSTSDEIETNGNGRGYSDCDEDDIPDYLDADPCNLSIPQGFSPNGDNVNDVFVIQRAIGTGDIDIEIYNRWGNKVYEAAPYENDWDGTNMFGVSIGDELPVGTYFYIIEINDKIYKGYIYLNR